MRLKILWWMIAQVSTINTSVKLRVLWEFITMYSWRCLWWYWCCLMPLQWFISTSKKNIYFMRTLPSLSFLSLSNSYYYGEGYIKLMKHVLRTGLNDISHVFHVISISNLNHIIDREIWPYHRNENPFYIFNSTIFCQTEFLQKKGSEKIKIRRKKLCDVQLECIMVL